jgi:ADP-L-glycero-D-manno-heptose 6-epimerase
VRVVVTGAAGFIGSNLARALNDRGVDDVIAVDSLVNGDKFRNLVDLSLADYIDADTFIAELEKGRFGKIDAIFHQGACSDTMERDGRYMLLNNFQYSKDLLSYCLTSGTRFIYASSAATYGLTTTFVPDAENERPLNVYGYSKLLFDQYVRRILPTTALQITGFRYFNVYGPHEEHKGRMASVAFHHFNQYRDHGRVKLFSSYGGFGDGGHSRDFVYVRDVTDVNCWFLENPDARGIYNLGTGHSQPFNDLAQAVVNVMRHGDGLPPLSLEQQVNQGLIEYIPFPDDLRGKYQSFTEADISGLRNAGYSAPFATVAEGITDYMGKLIAPHQQL